MIVSNKYALLILLFFLTYWICCSNDEDTKEDVITFKKLKIPIFITCILYIILFTQDNISQEIYTDPFFLRC